jgi:hypothetical protein
MNAKNNEMNAIYDLVNDIEACWPEDRPFTNAVSKIDSSPNSGSSSGSDFGFSSGSSSSDTSSESSEELDVFDVAEEMQIIKFLRVEQKRLKEYYQQVNKQILLEKEKMLTCCFLWSALIAFWTIIYSLSFFRRYTMDELKEGRTFIYICLLSQLI